MSIRYEYCQAENTNFQTSSDSASCTSDFTLKQIDNTPVSQVPTKEELIACVAAANPAAAGLTIAFRQLNSNNYSCVRGTITTRLNLSPPCTPADFTFSGTTAGQSKAVRTQALAHIGDYGTDAANHGGAINVIQGANGGLEVEGVEVETEGLAFAVNCCFPPGTIDCVFLEMLSGLSNHCNSSPWLCFAAGNARFRFAEFAGSLGGKENVRYHIIAEPTQTNVDFGTGQVVPLKRGCDHIWFSYEIDTDGNDNLIKSPKGAHVEQIYPMAPFSVLGC